MSSKRMYSKRMWLNREDSVSTGSVVAYRGEMIFEDNEKKKVAFLEVADCHNKIRLHVTPTDTMDDFIVKMETLRDFINDYVVYLRSEEKEEEDRFVSVSETIS